MYGLYGMPWERPEQSRAPAPIAAVQEVATDEKIREQLAVSGYSVDFSDDTLGQRFFGAPNDSLLVSIWDDQGVKAPCISLIRMHQLLALGPQTSNIVSALRIARDNDLAQYKPYMLIDNLGQLNRHKTVSGGWVSLHEDGLRVDGLRQFSDYLLQNKIRKLGPDRVSALANFCLAAADVWSVNCPGSSN